MARRRHRPPSRHSPLRWEALGHSVTGLEALETRQMLAANLSITLDDNLVSGITRQYYSPGAQIVYTLKVTNSGDQDAVGAALTTALAPAITQATWTAAYSSGSQGDLAYDDSGTPRVVPNVRAGMGNLAVTLTVAAGGSATFSIIATVGGAATGDLVSSAQIAFDGVTTSATDTDRAVPNSVVVTDDAGWASSSLVKLIDPATGAARAAHFAFEPGLKTGVRAALADLDADGKAEVVAVPGRGRLGEIVVLTQSVDALGSVTLAKDATLGRVVPFAGWRRGLEVTAGDFDGDGDDDVAVAQAGGSGLISIYRSTLLGPQRLVVDRTFTVPEVAGPGGVSLAAGDFGTFANNAPVGSAGLDGRAELVVASRGGVAAAVAIVDAGAAAPAAIDVIEPFGPGFLGGVSVAVARISRDSIPDLILSQGRGGSSNVEIHDGRVGSARTPLATFAAFAGLAASSAPVFTVARDVDGDGRADRIDAVQGGAGRASLRSFTVNTADATGVVSIEAGGSSGGVAGRLRIAAASSRNALELVTTDSGLQYVDLAPGTGATLGNRAVKVDYTGTYMPTAGTLAPKVFDSSKVQKGAVQPAEFSFTVGSNQVIDGWDEGVATMKVGGIRQLIVPKRLGYGNNNNSPYKDFTLTFEVKVNSAP